MKFFSYICITIKTRGQEPHYIMTKTYFTDKQIKDIADFAMNNKQFQKQQQKYTNYILEQVKQGRR